MGIYLKLDKIESDAGDDKHKGWIACDSCAWGAQRSMALKTGAGMARRSDGARLNEVTLRMKMHKGSPKVFLASLTGGAQKAKIEVTRAGDTSGALNVLNMELADAYVSSYQVDYDGDVPWETITLNYTKITKEYRPPKPHGGVGDNIPTGFDLATGKKP
jgi:type VI secretion system secreted protein Hcp